MLEVLFIRTYKYRQQPTIHVGMNSLHVELRCVKVTHLGQSNNGIESNDNVLRNDTIARSKERKYMCNKLAFTVIELGAPLTTSPLRSTSSATQ